MTEEHPLNNRYRIEGKIGEGGMATVYCGTDSVLRRRVAIKIMRDQYATDAEFIARFYQEAEAAAKLSHPNVVATYDVGHEDALYYIVMELVDGPSLADLLAEKRGLPEPVVIEYAAQICNGLAYAHRQGLLHRDVKPANILITKDDVVKLSDFGIARAVSQHTMALTKPGLVMGSVFYISPEQAQDHALAPSSDLYSLGVVLYQMLTGRLPYTGESPVTVALKHVSEPVPMLDTVIDGVSPALASITNKLLQKRPEHRFASATEVAAALREARERPSIASFAMQDDSISLNFARTRSQQLPRRESPLPDRRVVRNDAVPSKRSGSPLGTALALAALLIVAITAGYLIFGRPLFSLAPMVSVADYTGLTDAQAQREIVNAGLSVRLLRTPSDTVLANRVVRQSPGAGTSVPKNSVVELVVSNGLPLIGLRDVRGFTVDDAKRDLVGDKFRVNIVRRNDAAAKDTVIDQRPKAGSSLHSNSTVTLVVSDGPAPLIMPRLIGLTDVQARALASKDGFTLDDAVHQPTPGTDVGEIVTQDIAPGTQIDRTTVVHAIVSSGASAIAINVPDVRGQSLDSARSFLAHAGLNMQITYRVQSDANGAIVDQQPLPGSTMAAGSAVTLTLSVPGAVPDTEGMSVAEARSTLHAAGYVLGSMSYTTKEGADGKVIGTSPDVGTTLPPGSLVGLIVNGTGP